MIDEVNLAIQDFDKAIGLDRDDVSAWTCYTTAFLLLGQPLDAIDILDVAISKDPAFAPAYYFRGQAWAARNEHEKSQHDFDEAKRLNLEFPRPSTGA